MKKKWIWMMLLTSLLFASCRQEIPENTPGSTITPTGCEAPTCTPAETPEAELPLGPSVVPTVTEVPVVETVPTPTQIPEPTDVPEPTEAPEPTGEVLPTAEPTVIPEQPELPSPSPSPVPNAELLVNHGWQRAISIDENYEILFPELFLGSSLEKTDRELTVFYTAPSDDGVSFKISYHMQTTLDEFLSASLLTENAVAYDNTEENRVSAVRQESGTLCRGILIESRYAKTLLGNAFAGEEWIPGVMEVTFSYPSEQKQLYETAEYEFYVINFGRE